MFKLLFEALCFLFLDRKAALIGVRFASFLSHPRSYRFHFCIHDLKTQSFLESMESDDAAKSVVTSFNILSKLGLCTLGLRGRSIMLVKPSDPQVVSQITDRIAALFRLPPQKVCIRMNTRTVNDDFDPAAFEDMFHCLSPKITAFWNAEDAMRRDDKARVAEPIADAAVSVGLLVLAPIAHEAASLRPFAEALHADEEEPVWPPASASNFHFL